MAIITVASSTQNKQIRFVLAASTLMPILLTVTTAVASNSQAEALYLRAKLHRESFATKQQALKEIDQALALDPKNSLFLFMKADIILKVNEDGDSEALKYANEAIKYNPDNANAWNLKAQICLRRKTYEEALKYSNQAVETGNNHWLYRTQRAEILCRSGQKAAAIKELDECLKVTQSNPATFELRTAIAEADKDWTTAIKLRTALIALAGNASNSLLEHYEKRSKAYEALKQYDKAIADLNAASRLSTVNHGIHYKLLKLYKLKGDRAGIDRETSFIKSLEEDMPPP